MLNYFVLGQVSIDSEMVQYLLRVVIPSSVKCSSLFSMSSFKPGFHPGTASSSGSDATVLYIVEQT